MQALLVGIALLGSRAFAQDAPTVFAPGTISELVADSSPALFPDGKLLIFEHADQHGAELRFSEARNGSWLPPVRAPFSGHWNDLEPTVAASGKSIIFVSSRPRAGVGEQLTGRWNGSDHPNAGGNLWRVDAVGGEWGEPYRLPDAINDGTSVFSPTLSGDGTLFFMRADRRTERFRIFEARFPRTGAVEVEPLPFSTGDSADCDPAIAPDGSYLVFTSDRDTPKHLRAFISFREALGWSRPVPIEPELAPDKTITDLHLSPDQSTLFFSHDRVIWQVAFQPLLKRARAGQGGADALPIGWPRLRGTSRL